MAARAALDNPSIPSGLSPTIDNHGVCSVDLTALMTCNVLILGGTSEGRLLAAQLATDPRFACVLSLAGRTRNLQLPDTPHRVGGFGGVDGLAAYLRERRIHALVDTTHPFAARISANAVSAALQTGTALLRFARKPWAPVAGDRWLEVDDMPAACAALGKEARRVFLSIGRLEIAAFHAAPQHHYLVRAVDPFETGLPQARLITARGPFDLDAERALLREADIEIVVSKNSGTAATYAKIAAARELELPVVLVRMPRLPPVHEVDSLDAIVPWLVQRAHEASSTRL